MSTKDDIAIARRFEPTEDGRFLHRADGKEYELTRAQAGALARRLERTQIWWLLFSLFMMFHFLDFFFDLDGPGFWGVAWFSIRGAAAFLALAAAIFAVVEDARAAALLKDCASSEIVKPEEPAKPWRQRLAALQNLPEIGRMSTRNLIFLGLMSSAWLVVTGLILSTSPSWIADSSAWLGEAAADWFIQGVLYFGTALFVACLLLLAIQLLVLFAICLKSLHERFQGTELEGTNGA